MKAMQRFCSCLEWMHTLPESLERNVFVPSMVISSALAIIQNCFEIDLLEMEEEARTKLLHGLGYTDPTLQDLDTAVQAMPIVDMSAQIFVEGEEEIQEGDIITCQAQHLH